MSLHKCPNCLEERFSWQNDHEVSLLTIWDCWDCGYRAFEDESLESPCPDCQYKYRMQMKDEVSNYWWCTKCETKTLLV